MKFYAGRAINAILAVACAIGRPACGQEAGRGGTNEAAPPSPKAGAGASASSRTESSFHRLFFDDVDGKLDFSNALARGGFVPVPVIITEPAVDGGFGLVAQFISLPRQPGGSITRRMIGGAKTGNGSYGYGAFQSGSTSDGRISYKLGIGRGKITLTAHPRLLPDGLEYTNSYDYAALASVRLHLADRRISFGPLVDFRQLHSKLDLAGLPEQLAGAFDRKLNTGAIGFGLHFDSRDNALSPSSGVNIYAEGKFNTQGLGSDREFQIYDVHGYGFVPLSPRWSLGGKLEVDTVQGNYPAYFARSVNLRGVEARRYQGGSAASAEAELSRRLSTRWSVLAFVGIGFSDAGGKRIFEDSGAIVAGGGGFRYLIARKAGLQAGIDAAAGPDGAVFYLQFGHAWGFGMD